VRYIATLNNLENVSGMIKLRTRNFPTGKFTIRENVPIKGGDLIQFNARFRSNGSVEYISDSDGYTVNASDNFKDDDATFQTNNVAINDILWIKEDTHEGYYRIYKIVSQTQVNVCGLLFVADIDGYTTNGTDDFKDDTTDAFADVSVAA